MKEEEKKTLKEIESLSLCTTEQERNIIIAYVQGIALGRKIALEEKATKQKEEKANGIHN